MFFDIGASAKVASTGLSVVKPLWSVVHGLRIKRALKRDIGEILGIQEDQDCSYRVGMSHPTVQRGSFHPDDVTAFRALAGPSLSRCLETGWLNLQDSLASDLESNLILIGAPGPESLSRLVFGYRQRDGGGLSFTGDTLDLPFRWQEDVSVVRANCLRYQQGGLVTTRPNWPILDSRTGSVISRYPETNCSGFLLSDYLLVTKVPNFITPGAQASGRSVVSFGGSHGIGTRAVSLLLDSSEVMRRLGEEYSKGGSRYFQALLEARSIVHEPRTGSHAKRLALVAFVPLAFHDSTLDHSRQAIYAHYTDWAREAGGRGIEIPSPD